MVEIKVNPPASEVIARPSRFSNEIAETEPVIGLLDRNERTRRHDHR